VIAVKQGVMAIREEKNNNGKRVVVEVREIK